MDSVLSLGDDYQYEQRVVELKNKYNYTYESALTQGSLKPYSDHYNYYTAKRVMSSALPIFLFFGSVFMAKTCLEAIPGLDRSSVGRAASEGATIGVVMASCITLLSLYMMSTSKKSRLRLAYENEGKLLEAKCNKLCDARNVSDDVRNRCMSGIHEAADVCDDELAAIAQQNSSDKDSLIDTALVKFRNTSADKVVKLVKDSLDRQS